MTDEIHGSAFGLVPASPSDELAIGSMVGEYQITGKIGQGGMGTVYGALHPIIGKRAAVKVIHREAVSRPDATQRFIQEAQAVNQISHPNIVDIFSLGTLPDGRPYFLMELLDGESLGARLRRGPLAFDESVRLLEQICSVLEATHAKGIIHRDLKPENVFIDRRNGHELVKLLDFGIAKLKRPTHDAPELTAVGSAMGTPAYLSPELARGRTVDTRSDIYSLGVIAFELFTGQLPFAAESAIDYIMAHVGTPPPRPSSLQPDLPRPIEQMLLAMLDKDPAGRPTVREIQSVLSQAHARVAGTPAGDIRPHSSSPLGTQPTVGAAPPRVAPPISASGISDAPARVHVSSGPPGGGPAGTSGEYKCKGSHIVMAARWIDEHLGPNTFKSLVQAKGPPWNAIYLEGSWFDVDPLNEALTVVGQKLGRTVEDLTMEIARLNALEDLTSMYRFFLRIAAPQRVMSFTPRLWSTYVAFGQAKAALNEPGHYVGQCDGIPRHLLNWSSGAWRGFVPTAIELAGGKDVRGSIRGTWPMGTGDLWRLECEISYKL